MNNRLPKLLYNTFQLSVESNCAIALSTRGDWLKISRQFINQWNGKPITTCTRDFSRALSKLHGIVTNLDWFIAMFAPAVIGRSNNYFGICFTTLDWKLL